MKLLNILILIFFVLIIIFSYYFGFNQKKTKIQKINEENLYKYENKKKEIIEQIDSLNKKKEIIEENINSKKENFNHLIEIEKSHEEEILKNYKQKRLAEINH